jgi:hypothetical protein
VLQERGVGCSNEGRFWCYKSEAWAVAMRVGFGCLRTEGDVFT